MDNLKQFTSEHVWLTAAATLSLAGISWRLISSYSHRKHNKMPTDIPKVPTGYFFSSLFGTNYDYHGTFLKEILPLMEEHGIVELNGGLYMIGDIEASRYFSMYPERMLKFSPLNDGRFHGGLFGRMSGLNMVNTNGALWRKYRHVANPAFRRTSWPVEVFKATAEDVFKQWQLSDTQSVTVDVADWMQRFTLDVLGRALFSHDFKAIEDHDSPSVVSYRNIMNAGLQRIWFIFPRLDRRWNPFRRHLHADLDQFQGLLSRMVNEGRQRIEERRAAGIEMDEKDKDLLTLMLEANEAGETGEEQKLTDKELRDNLAIFFIAGHDTTAIALTGLIYHLAKYPEVQEKLRAEAFEVLGQDQLPLLTTKLPYLEAVIKESLRMVPPVPQFPLRVSRDEHVFCGRVFPAGTKMMLSTYALHYNSKYWDNPNVFSPERFLDKSFDRHAWMTFSSGTRSCIGMNFSLAEQRVFMCELVRRFRWRLPEDSIHKDHLKFRASVLVTPLPVEITFERLH